MGTTSLLAEYDQASHNGSASPRERVTQAQRNKNDKQWYKDKINMFSGHGSNSLFGYGGVSEYKRKKVNYDLFNNIIDKADFAYVCEPYGTNVGELPARLTNRDIVSGKIKVLLGMEMNMPFSWNVIATNEQATTRREQAEFGKIKDYVIGEIMNPIDVAIKEQERRATNGRELTPEERQALSQELAKQRESMTPDEVRKYMARKHQDPAEVLMRQILNYLIHKENIPFKFNKGFKHLMLSGEEVFRLDIINGEPCLIAVNPLHFEYDISDDLDFIQDGEWARCEYQMSPSQIVSYFGSELTEAQIDRIYSYQDNWSTGVTDADFTFDEHLSSSALTVTHTTWKSLRKLGFLTYYDINGEQKEKLVDETYKFNAAAGDIKIEWEWIPEAHEGWRILNDIFVQCRPVPGQHKDLDNLYECPLPYYGIACDNMNSPVTSAMDRMKSYQYLYNIVIYRIELLMASDKGKILAANIKKIPKSSGLDTEKFMYFMEANKIAFFNPSEDGERGEQGMGHIAQVLDMSLASDIAQYVQIAEFIKNQCGNSVGVTPQMEAQIAPGEAVSNTRQNIQMASYIVRPYYDFHNALKGKVLQALIEKAKVAWGTGKPRKLSYMMDDLSYYSITTDPEMLDSSTYGLFMSNSTKAEDAKQMVIGLAQAALQNQQADLADIIKVITSDSVNEAAENFEVSQARKTAELQAAQIAQSEAQERIAQRQESLRRDEMEHEKELIRLKERERRETEIQKQTILSLGFNEDKDLDKDGTPDVLEVAKLGVNAKIQQQKLDLDRDKLDQKTEHDAEKLKLEKEKIKKMGQNKNNSK